MPGSYAEIAALAEDPVFVLAVKVAAIKAANQFLLTDSGSGIQSCAQKVLDSLDSYTPRLAWLLAAGSEVISASAPVIPKDAEVQDATYALFKQMVR